MDTQIDETAYTCWTGQKCRATVAYRSRGWFYLFSSAERRMDRGCLRMPRPSKLETEDELLQAKQDLRLAACEREETSFCSRLLLELEC
jgi:hypothetical protein